ncbi:hypothetical protein EZV62_003818 [Acer yangbiense]|uniref:Uncharacterized protein n=1 Tax=Acer yangbiense TaxID=1000413 RepID=A0A5C7II16_9ROSI|nr:hypothetical protein EZV62_003818 [Acer yangbiense]
MSWPSGSLPAIPPLFSDDNPHQQRQESSHIRQQNAGKETVGLDSGCSSSQMKNRKLRSNVWEHFHKYKDKDGTTGPDVIFVTRTLMVRARRELHTSEIISKLPKKEKWSWR